MNDANVTPSETTETGAAAAATPPSDPAAPAAAGKPRVPSFAELGVRPEVLKALEEMGFAEPMDVQAATLPPISRGRDLMVQSRTGSGKRKASLLSYRLKSTRSRRSKANVTGPSRSQRSRSADWARAMRGPSGP